MGRISHTPRITSKYFDVQRVPDYLAPDLDVLFCGINPGAESGAQRHHYAHRSNHFYTCLHGAGLTRDKLTPADDWTFPTLTPYRLGLTNLVHRATARSEQLTRSELEEGVPELLAKVREYHPRVVCFVGKQIGDVFLRVARAKLAWGEPAMVSLPPRVLGFWHAARADGEFPAADAGYGVMPICVEHQGRLTLFFVAPSTSARVTHHLLPGKTRIMAHLPPLVDALAAPATAGARVVHVPRLA